MALTSDTVSGNRRLYKRAVVEQACERAQERIKAGRMLMCSSHRGYEQDDPSSVVGRVVELTCDSSGVLHYTAELAPTRAAEEVFALCSGPRSHLSVSIRGQWLGPLTREDGPDGLGPVEHAPDGLELLGLDTCLNPGIAAATVQAAERLRNPALVLESVTVDPALPGDLSLAQRYAADVVAGVHSAAAGSVAAWAAAAEAARAPVAPTPDDERRRALAAWVMSR